MSKKYDNVGLTKLRLESGLWLNTLADAVGVTHQTYKSYEYGKIEPSFKTLSILAIIFKKDIHEVFNAALESAEFGRGVPFLSPEEVERFSKVENPPASGYSPRKRKPEANGE